MQARHLGMETVRGLSHLYSLLDQYPFPSCLVMTLIVQTVQKDFVKVVRAVEMSLGTDAPGSEDKGGFVTDLLSNILERRNNDGTNRNATASLLQTASALAKDGQEAAARALSDAAPMLAQVAAELGETSILFQEPAKMTPLVTK